MADLMQAIQNLLLHWGKMFEAMSVPASMVMVPLVVIGVTTFAVWAARFLGKLTGHT